MIPLNDLRRQSQSLLPELLEAAERVHRRGYYCLGPEVAAFEDEFAAYCGVSHCISVNSGTDAIEMALRAVGVRVGDRVATTATVGGYSSTAIRTLGALPRYVDTGPEDVDMSTAGLLAALEAGAKAVIVTHLYGRIGNVVEVGALCREWGVPLIEDCAHAHGARLESAVSGSLGDIGCFSFYPTKNLGAAGDGGAVVTDDEALHRRCRGLCQYGWQEKYLAIEPGGRNTRMDELQAAILRLKLPHLDAWNRRRRQIAATYSAGLSGTSVVEIAGRAGERDVVHLYVVRVPDRDIFLGRLTEAGVGAGIHYPVPDHLQPAFGPWAEWDDLARSERFCNEVVSLPCFPEILDDEVAKVIDAVRSCAL